MRSPHPRSSRSSASSSSRICRRGARWRSSAFARRRSIAGMIAIEPAASKRSKTGRRSPIGSGTAFPTTCASAIVEMALESPSCQPRELATRFTDTEGYFVSEASVYRLLKAHDLITSPAFIVIKAADEFKDKTTAPNQLWQTDFTYLKVIGWGWFYLSTILDDFSRYIIAWKLCTTMRAEDVTDTLELALAASGCDQRASCTSHGCSATTARATSRAILANGSKTPAWGMSAARPIIRRPRARSSAGTRRSRTASCSRTTICPAISKPRSIASSSTTITGATTRACTT